MPDYEYRVSEGIDCDQLLEFYRQQNHPISGERVKLQRMIDQSFCFVTAWREGRLIGIARGVTDGIRGYLTECKLDPAYQGPAAVTRTDGRIEHDEHGVARAMAQRVIEALREYGVERIDVLAYGTEVDFCEELGFKKLGGVVPLQLTPTDVPQSA